MSALLDARGIDQEQIDGLVKTTSRASLNWQDAEDAVQDAWLVLHEKASQLEAGPVGGYLMRTARFKAMHARSNTNKATSLDALVEVAGDSVSALSDGAFSLDASADLAELSCDPVGVQIVQSVGRGGAAHLAPRGENHQNARYTDAQVDQVRILRREGVRPCDIERQTGVPASYVHALARRASRVTGTTEGWNRSRILEAIRRFHARHGRAPRYHDNDPLLASPTTVAKHFGSWGAACSEAGVVSAYAGRRTKAWTVEEITRAFCGLRLELGRWPTLSEIHEHSFSALPSLATLQRRLGSNSRRTILETVTKGLCA